MNQSLAVLLPHLASVQVKSVEIAVDAAVFVVASIARTAQCPRCEVESARTHGGYRRTLADLPIAGRQMRLNVDIRRFRCFNAGCAAVTFAEQIPGLTAPFARRTEPL